MPTVEFEGGQTICDNALEKDYGILDICARVRACEHACRGCESVRVVLCFSLGPSNPFKSALLIPLSSHSCWLHAVTCERFFFPPFAANGRCFFESGGLFFQLLLFSWHSKTHPVRREIDRASETTILTWERGHEKRAPESQSRSQNLPKSKKKKKRL